MDPVGGSQGFVRRVVVDGVPRVLKSPRGGLLRPVSRWFLRRELRVYRKLDGVFGVPHCFGLTAEGLLLEPVDGKPLSEFRRGLVTTAFLDQLDRIIADIHARGVVHSDLKKRENILVVESAAAGAQPVIVDFGAAFLEGHPLFETFRRIDLAAAAKLRAHHQPDSLRPGQRVILDNPTWAERLSRFLIHTVRDPFRRISGNG